MNHSATNITSTRQERFEQYSHPAYRGAVDVEDDKRFTLVPPGVNLAIFGSEAHANNEEAIYRHISQRLARDIDHNRLDLPVILASSRLEAKKNHLGLVQAFAGSQTLRQKANLVLITGALDNPLHDDSMANSSERQVLAQIRQVVEDNQLWGKISAFAIQGQPSLAAAYRFFAKRGSLFALTALYEPFGLAPLEAAATGLPVVVTQNGGPSESLKDGDQEYGILVNPSDPADIAHGIESLLISTENWQTFSRRGHQRVLDHYTWEHTAEGYLTILSEILANPIARRPAQLLPIHSFFLHPTPENKITPQELWQIYQTGEEKS